MTDLRNAVVLVTGANGGLGRLFVTEALSRGATKVYATARTPRTWDDERVVPLALDITSTESIAAAAEQAGDVTVLINNAGISAPRLPVLRTPLDDVRRVFETNVFGQVAMLQAFAPVLARNGGGAVIDVHSSLSWLAMGTYSATKAAFWSFTNALRLELLEQGTQVVGAHLGYTDTPMTAALDVPKEDPRDIVEAIYTGLEAGELEVLADDTSREVKQALAEPLPVLYPALAR
ncbi:SDR family oxidoreductase [Promicromonospora citrea]|uniref:Short-chain dehydrogenase n=1 Tax=Promicromonospora citrea TaxID=43677 RepID=A0A8H9GNM0_9MICO|nr:SDR family oxidoreductase [Promicromonospora citrea]NNH52029.1 SDR family oxidoreductase [Promicromonospora citrea]GGM34156.1 short-chain dehydrogenase [Promicromonospora citrea]